jgi:hypothetical protein
MSPQQAITTSGLPSASLLAHRQMSNPRVQCRMVLHRQPVQRRLLAGDDHVT